MTYLKKYFLIFLVLVLPFAVGASALVPEVNHYWVWQKRLSQEFIEAWNVGHPQRRALLDELGDIRIGVLGEVRGIASRQSANSLLDGSLTIAHYSPIPIELPFSEADLLKGEPSLQLQLGSLLTADIMLEAYIHSGDPMYLESASDMARDFIRFENGRWLPYGFLWNDHAVAARALFLTRLINELTKFGSTDPDVMTELFQALERAVRLLAKPSHFTYRTNHGIMQSIAVLHIALFAPQLPAVSEFLDDVVARLIQQMEYFVSDDGVVLEHSVGYQEFGVRLLDYAIRYMHLLDREVPEEWLSKRERSREFYGHLIRDDNTIPRQGDTSGFYKGGMNLMSGSREENWVSQDAGYWSSWFGAESHLFVSWANFVSRAHKHADELSLVFWSSNEEWWTGAGYWPFGHPWRDWGTGWDSGNAPHEVGEASGSVRKSHVVGLLLDENVRFLHLRRERPDGYQVDRIIVAPFNGPWFVFDSPSGTRQNSTESSWSTMVGVSVDNGTQPGAYTLASPRSAEKLIVNVTGGQEVTHQWTSGSTDPIAGWISGHGVVRPANTLLVKIPAKSWSLVAWGKVGAGTPQAFVDKVEWPGPDSFSFNYRTSDHSVEIRRDRDILSINGAGNTKLMLKIKNGVTRSDVIHDAEQAYTSMAASFDNYRNLLPWRVKILQVLTVVGFLQILVFFVYRRLHSKLPPRRFLQACAAIWIITGVWIHAVYLVV